MATSDVEIVNSALIKIGERTIASLTEDRKAARVAKRQYPRQRRALLRVYRWNFAIRRSDPLAPEVPAPKFGFTNRFRFPTNTLRVLGIHDENEAQVNYTSSRIPFKVEGGFVYTDEVAPEIFYIIDEIDPQKFDPLFEEALALKLAWDLAYALSSGLDIRNQVRDDFREVIKEAKNTDAIEGNPEVVEASDWIDSRQAGNPLRIGNVWPF